MSNNIEVLLVGTGYMGKEYARVLKEMNVCLTVVGRGEESAALFEIETGILAVRGGLDNYLRKEKQVPCYAIVASSVESSVENVTALLKAGVKNILAEKPVGLNIQEVKMICDLAEAKNANVYAAYNRRYYASTEKALQIISEDGGVVSYHFEFTEWVNQLEKVVWKHSEKVLNATIECNSSHVIDLAFFLGGQPNEMTSYIAGENSVDWHRKCAVYAGAGRTEKGALLSYCANWIAPGRWGIEVMTKKHRLYLKPMEELYMQELDSIRIEKVDIDDSLDKRFKPGLYKEVQSFLMNTDIEKRKSIQQQLTDMRIYEQMEMNSLNDIPLDAEGAMS